MYELIVICYGVDVRNAVDNLIDSAIGERLIGNNTTSMWDEKDLKFIISLLSEADKNNLVNYIYTWLPYDMRDFVKFYNKKDKPDISFKNAAFIDSAMNKILEDW